MRTTHIQPVFGSSVRRLFAASALAAGICISGSASGQVLVTENFNDNPLTDGFDPANPANNTNWVQVNQSGDTTYNFQPAGTDTDGNVRYSPSGVNPPIGTATGPGEAGGSSGRGGYYGDNFNGMGTLNLNQPLSASGVMAIGDNDGGHYFGFANTSLLPLVFTPERQRHPGQFLGFATESGGGPPAGHRVILQIGGTAPGEVNNFLRTTAFLRPDDATAEDPSGNIQFDSIHSFDLNYDPGSADGPNFGSMSLFMSGGMARPDQGGDDGSAETFTYYFTDSAGERPRPDPTGISYDLLGMFGNEGQDLAYDDLTYTSPIPEPASIALLGMAGLLALRRRR